MKYVKKINICCRRPGIKKNHGKHHLDNMFDIHLSVAAGMQNKMVLVFASDQLGVCGVDFVILNGSVMLVAM